MQHVANVVREGKEYDMDDYRRKAEERKARMAEEKQEGTKASKDKRIYPELKPDDGMGGPRRDFMKAREAELNLAADVGKRRLQTIAPTATAKDQAGFYCEVCDCNFKDSMTYVDHINGKKHQRMLGMSTRVERQGVDAVKAKLAALREKKNQDAAAKALAVEQKIQKRQLEWSQEEEAVRQARRDAKRRKKERERDTDDPPAAAADGGSESDMMMKMMGFGAFK